MHINVIGCGGIGSYFSEHLFILKKQGQLNNVTVDVYDNDEVENKNLMYQNYSIDDVFKLKAEVIALRYGFNCKPKRVTEFNLVKGSATAVLTCLCVDNIETRKAFFNSPDFAAQSKSTMHGWIDMRCQGAQVAIYTRSPKNTKERMLTTLPESQEEGTASCQYAADLFANKIQQGNKIIAAIGSQAVLNIFRGEAMTSTFIHGF
jgi:hypothetical protein